MVFKDDSSLGEEIIIGVLNYFPNFELNLREFYEQLIEIPGEKHPKQERYSIQNQVKNVDVKSNILCMSLHDLKYLCESISNHPKDFNQLDPNYHMLA